KASQYLDEAGVGLRVRGMPRGMDTYIYRNFEEDGIEISGGEAQKIAIARALYKDAPFVILDEPTAALDPISEYEIYSSFDTLVGQKTAVYISHRLSSCRFCHDIAVFHEGRLIQRGDHDTLVAVEDGKYAEMWQAQAQYYVEV
ncbi:MAG: ATP-binding cassette domain-containing protein, partial [Symbiobacteriaceae bacterium]|nr:ATP-binding cassette domain-containing protein [Symbiobacteriaceae bacterium]